MKNILLLVLLGGAATATQAQNTIKAGTVALGGSIGYAQQHLESSGTTTQATDAKTFFAAPSVGYFIADNLAIGLSLSYYAAKNTDFYGYSAVATSAGRSTQIGGGAFMQYYQMLTKHVWLGRHATHRLRALQL